MRRSFQFIWPVIGLAAILLSSWFLYRELKGLSAADLEDGFRAIRPGRYALAAGAAALAYAALAWYDRIALLHIGRPLSWLFISVTSFTSYALSHNIGMSMLSGGVVRYRAYSSKGLSVSDVAMLVAFCSFTFALGAVLCGGAALALDPWSAQRFLAVPAWAARLVGCGLLGLVVAYAAACLLRSKPLRLGSFLLDYPRPAVMVRQLAAGPLELIGAAGIVYFALPPAANPGFLAVLLIFVAAFSAALLSHSPGGLGVLEIVFLKALPDAPVAQVVAALIVFRVLYLLIPLAFGILVVLAFERDKLIRALRRPGRKPPC